VIICVIVIIDAISGIVCVIIHKYF
jgi:hypothetical protein